LGGGTTGRARLPRRAEADGSRVKQRSASFHNWLFSLRPSAATYSPTSSSSKRVRTLDFPGGRLMAWALRGLREGIVTTGYPKKADGYGAKFKSSVSVLGAGTDPSPARATDVGRSRLGTFFSVPDRCDRREPGRGRARPWPLHPLRSLCRDAAGSFRLRIVPRDRRCGREHLVVPGRVESDERSPTSVQSFGPA